jgi:hypothetical protein
MAACWMLHSAGFGLAMAVHSSAWQHCAHAHIPLCPGFLFAICMLRLVCACVLFAYIWCCCIACRAVKKLLASDQLAVVSENTILIALAGWLEAHARSNSSSGNAVSIPGSSNAGAAGGSAEAAQQQQQQQPQQHLPVQHSWGNRTPVSAALQLQQQHKDLAELVSRRRSISMHIATH